jgi:hypothetical protein
LSERQRLGISRLDPGSRRHFQIDRPAGDLHQDHGRERQPRALAFCPQCGSPIYSTTPGDGPQASYMVRVGILRQRDQLMPQRQIWFRSARPWVTELGGIPSIETQQGTSHLR